MVYSSSPLAVLASTKNGSFTFAQDEWIPNDVRIVHCKTIGYYELEHTNYNHFVSFSQITEGSIQIIEGNQVGAAIEANPDDGVLLVKGKGLLIWKQVEGIQSVEDRLSIVVAKVLYMLEAYEKIFKIELKRNTFYAIAPTAMQANVPQPAVNQSGGMDDE